MDWSRIVAAVAVVALAPGARASSAPPAARSGSLRVVLAGLVHDHALGFLGTFQHRPGLEIAGIAEPDRALAAEYARRFGLPRDLFSDDLDAMLERVRPHVVLAFTSTSDHRRVVEACARHHVPVMMEKPLAVGVEDARAIADVSRAAGILVLVNYETTWYRSTHAARALAQDGSLGPIRKIVVHDGHDGPKEIGASPAFLAWLTDPVQNGGGALFDFGCYGADLATWLLDGRVPDAVTAVTQHLKPALYPGVEDEATIVLAYPGAQAILQASWNWPFGRKDIEVYGARGSVATIERDRVRVRLSGREETTREAPDLPAAYADSVAYLRAVVLEGALPEGLSSLETNLTVTRILDAARHSAADGRTIRLTDPR